MNVIFSALLISIASFSGVLFISKNAKNWLFKNIKYLVTFSAGIFLMTSLGLAGETFEFLSIRDSVFAIVGGFVFMSVLHAFLPETHHHHDDACPTCTSSKKGVKILVGDSIHNIADGIVLFAAFSVSNGLGLIAFLSVFVHEFIQEISEFFVLRQSGYSTKSALSLNFITSLSIFIGFFIGAFLVKSIEVQAVLIGFSAGAFLHIVFHDLIPYEEALSRDKKSVFRHIILFILGISLILFLGFIFPHSH